MTKPQGFSTIEEDLKKPDMDRIVLLGLAVYFLSSVLIRVTISSTAEMDETEHLVYTQVLRLGYGSQLPLYAWLQRISFTIFGVNIFALSLLKYSLLFATYVCVLKIGRKALNETMGTVIATLSLFLIPQVVWEPYRTLTNTVLATLMAALTLLLILRLRERPDTANYLFLGMVAGLGMLSKYNYAIFLVALIAAGLSIPSFRKCLLSGKSILSMGIMAAITTGPYIWIVSNLDKATASSEKLKPLGNGNFPGDTLLGLGSLISAWIGYFWPAIIVYAFLYFFFKPVKQTSPDEDIHQLLKRTLIAAFIACSILVLFFKVTYFKERWMQPLLFFLPVYFMHYLDSRIDRKRFRGLLIVTLIPALLAALTFSGGVLLTSKSGKATRLSAPYKSLAARIQEEGFTRGAIITDDHRIGGNLKLHFKGSSILVIGMMEVPFDSTDPVMVIWNADRSGNIPKDLATYAGELLGVRLDTLQVRYVEEAMLYWEEKTMRLGYIIVSGQ